jgi:hypothetical protein
MQREKTKPRAPAKPKPKFDPDKHPEWDPRRVCPDQRTRTIRPDLPP